MKFIMCVNTYRSIFGVSLSCEKDDAMARRADNRWPLTSKKQPEREQLFALSVDLFRGNERELMVILV